MHQTPRIPTLVGILILLIGMAALIFLVENHQLFLPTQASTSAEPREVTVTNVGDTTFALTWITDGPSTGWIKYKERNPLGITQTVLDDRDSQNEPLPRHTHFVTVTGLKPTTTYEVTIVSDKKTYQTDPSLVTTGLTLGPPPQTIDPAFGSVIDSQDYPVPDALVHASFDGSQSLSTFTDIRGDWILPIGRMRTLDGNRYFIPQPHDQERLFFIAKEGRSIIITTIDNDSPLPLVRLGQNYNFTHRLQRPLQLIRELTTAAVRYFRIPTLHHYQLTSIPPVVVKPLQSLVKTGSPLVMTQAVHASSIAENTPPYFQVLLPKEGSSIPSGKPAFQGAGIAGKEVIVSINTRPQPTAGKTTVLGSGIWNWTPPTVLNPGKYLATITSFTSTNKAITQTVSFTVLKSGSSVLGEATPSASVSPLPSSRPSASPSPLTTPSASPVSSPPPVTGTWTPTAGIFLLSLALFTFGAAVIVKK